jgi:predicted nucleic acid-binding protein
VSYLLDTNVVSELRKKEPDPHVVRWFEAVESADLYISVLVVGEIRKGIERLRRRGDNRQASTLDRWLGELKDEFGNRLVSVSTAIAERWGTLSAGQPLTVVDGLLAATAIEHGLTLVTREHDALTTTGAVLLDPWTEP